MEYSTISKKITNTLSKDVKKNNGIYFTPPSCVMNNIKLLEPYLKKNAKVLEPSCGSCEYITALHNLYPNLFITGIEYNKIIYESINHLNNSKINIINDDYLKYEMKEEYDLIIGNPPYYVMKKKNVEKDYYKYFEGRPNIFILFIIKSLKLLNNNGILSFILPKNFLNCLYYNKTREYIDKNFQILNIVECSQDRYLETEQDTIILIIQKTKNLDNRQFILKINNYTIFITKHNNEQIKNLCESSVSLASLGFKVSVGTIVWNQCKN